MDWGIKVSTSGYCLEPVALAELIVGGFFAYRYLGACGQINSIAVMPFVNESDNAEREYLSDGMTETLVSTLLQLPNALGQKDEAFV